MRMYSAAAITGFPQRVDTPLGGRRRGLCGVLLAVFIGCLAFVSRADDAAPKEYQIKAAYLYNFAKFVEWPDGRFADAQSPLVIGVFGQNPFGDELRAIARDHKINGRVITIQSVQTPAEAQRVHLLFFPAAEDSHVAGLLADLKGASVLTVGESDQFNAAGGMICFVRQADKVRFEIDAAAAEQHGLKISAQLLKLARPQGKQP
jgi:hypothetical protein